MSSTFSFSRLGKLITKQFYENLRFYAFCVLALFGLLAIAFAFWITTTGPNYQEEATYMIFILGLFLAGGVFASMSFHMLSSKDKGIYWLSVPATHLEKLVCTIFYSVVMFTIVYCLCFYIAKSIGISFLEGYLKNHPGSTYKEIKDFNSGFGDALTNLIYAYFIVQALYMLGSVYFSRYSFIVTTVAVAFPCFVFVYYLSRAEDSVLGPVNWDLVDVKKPDPSNKDSYFLYSVSPTVYDVLKYIVQFALAPVLWLVTWYRLKEKEV